MRSLDNCLAFIPDYESVVGILLIGDAIDLTSLGLSSLFCVEIRSFHVHRILI
jgi:hypothetical protein